MTPAAALLAAATTGISRGGSGIGAPCVVTTTTSGLVVVVVVVTTRRTSFLRSVPATAALRTTRFLATVYCLTTLGCVTRSTAYTPLPPMTAPPQAHAQSFAKAMRTDMMSHSSCCWRSLPTEPSAASAPSLSDKRKTNY